MVGQEGSALPPCLSWSLMEPFPLAFSVKISRSHFTGWGWGSWAHAARCGQCLCWSIRSHHDPEKWISAVTIPQEPSSVCHLDVNTHATHLSKPTITSGHSSRTRN